MSQSRWVAPLALAAVLALAGCTGAGNATGGPTPPTSASPTASASPTPSPTPSPTSTQEPEPTPGPDFDRVDEVGAQAAAKYAVDVILYTVRTGDTGAFDRLEWPNTCSYCRSVRNVTRDRKEEAPVLTGGDGTTEILKVYEFDSLGGGYPLDIRIHESESQLREEDGTIVRTEEAGTGDYRVELLHDGETWRLINMLPLEDIQ